MTTSALQDAIDKAGNQSKLADLLTKAAKAAPKGSTVRGRKFKQQHVSWWLSKSGGIVPAEVAPLFESAVGFPAHRMRPDLFSAQQAAA